MGVNMQDRFPDFQIPPAKDQDQAELPERIDNSKVQQLDMLALLQPFISCLTTQSLKMVLTIVLLMLLCPSIACICSAIGANL